MLNLGTVAITKHHYSLTQNRERPKTGLGKGTTTPGVKIYYTEDNSA